MQSTESVSIRVTTAILGAAILAAVGCAHAPAGALPGGGWCSIAEPGWAVAPRDFDRATTLEAIAGLRQAAAADRARAHLGASLEVGGELDQLYRHHVTSAFISRGVGELATRLRQLDCAVRAGRIPHDQSENLYARILAELGSEQAVLDPSGAGRSAASP